MNTNDEFYCPKCNRHKALSLRSDRKLGNNWLCKSYLEKAIKMASKSVQRRNHAAAVRRGKSGLQKNIDVTLAYVKRKENT